MCKCNYCNREFKNNGAKAMHEKSCVMNPDRIEIRSWNKGLTKDNNDTLLKISNSLKILHKEGKYKNINYHIKRRKPVSEETRKKLSESLKKYFAENKDKHPWKSNSKYISAPCEFFKKRLREENINFIEEYTPFDDYAYAIDIAWPDLKVGIEINGNQHYNSDFSLKPYYQHRHDIFVERGWTLYEIYYKHVYSIDISSFFDDNHLDVYDKEYLDNIIINRTGQHQKIYHKTKNSNSEYWIKREGTKIKNKEILIDLKENSGIDFSKYGWVEQGKKYVLQKYNKSWKNMRKAILTYYPDFFDDSVYKRDN